MSSVWTEGISLPDFGSLDGDMKTDVLIIGGGITGILCAYFLKERGVSYALVEGRTICSQITKDTTAKITSQHALIYDKLLKTVGCEKAKMYLDANQSALQKYFELCKEIPCDFEKREAYVYSLDDRQKLEREAEALDKIGFYTIFKDETKLPFSVAGAIGFPDQAQFHPLKFISEIAKDLRIYEHTFVKELAEKTAVTDKGTIHFEKVIFATHFPIDNKHGMYFLKMYQHRSYVIALEDAGKVEEMYIDENRYGLSFRSYRDFLLLGGGAHRTGKRGGNWQELREFAKKYYPQAEERYHWATQDCMTLDGIPYIGPYSKNMPGCYVATGYNKWGMTSSMAAAMILADMITGEENPYAPVFDPSRNMIKPQLFVNGWEASVHLLSISEKRCPHMGCALKWNEAEHSWDCACHGSRFDEDGKVLDNPANGDMNR